MHPAIPDRMYTISTRHFPKVYSSLLTSSSKMRTLLIKCSIFTCRNCATTSRQTCPLYTLCESLMPISVRVSYLTSNTVFDESNPNASSTMKMTVIVMMSRAVSEVMWTEGQRVLVNMVQKPYQLGSTTATLPARKSTLWSSMQDMFSYVMPTRNMLLSTPAFLTRLEGEWLAGLFWLGTGPCEASIASLLLLERFSCMSVQNLLLSIIKSEWVSSRHSDQRHIQLQFSEWGLVVYPNRYLSVCFWRESLEPTYQLPINDSRNLLHIIVDQVWQTE